MITPDSPAPGRPSPIVLALVLVPAAIVTWGVHEYAHWQAGVALGHDMWISLNKAGPVAGDYAAARFSPRVDSILVASAGPLVTYVQAAFAFGLIRARGWAWLYPFLFLTVYTRALAMAMGFIAHPNDEASVSLMLGLPQWALPSIAVCGLLAATVAGSRRLRVGWVGNLVAYAAASAITAGIVFADQRIVRPAILDDGAASGMVLGCGCPAPGAAAPGP